MYSPLEELKNESLRDGEIHGIIQIFKLFNHNQQSVLKFIMKKFSLSQEAAFTYIKKYW